MAWSVRQIVPSAVLGLCVGALVPKVFPQLYEGADPIEKLSAGSTTAGTGRPGRTIDYDKVARACLSVVQTRGGARVAAPVADGADSVERERLEGVFAAAESRGVWTRRDAFLTEAMFRKVSPEVIEDLRSRYDSLTASGRMVVESGAIFPGTSIE